MQSDIDTVRAELRPGARFVAAGADGCSTQAALTNNQEEPREAHGE